MAHSTDTKIDAVGHTAGPWFVSRRYVVGPRDKSDSQGFGMIVGVADVYGDNRNQDARLIAAAPKLKDALAAMLDFWGGYECPEVDAAIAVMQEIGEDRWSMQAQMEAEAKAEGRAS